MNKLNAEQIGQLAKLCELIVKEFPENDPPDFAWAPDNMRPWEIRLKECVNKSPGLPEYDHPEVQTWTDEFMSYFS